MTFSRLSCFTVLTLMICTLPALALWPSDPATNLSIADRAGEQVVPKIAFSTMGGCYVAWHDHASGNYDIYLQYLSDEGDEVWPHNGLLISDHPQQSWITDWDLIADSNGNAVIVVNDVRSGPDWDIYAYKVAPDGTMLWGADGVTISDNADFEPSPKVTETTDGEFVVVWARSPDVGDGSIMMQRLEADGTPRLPYGGVPVAGEVGESPSFCVICPGDAGSVIVGWLRDTSQYLSDRHYRAEKFDAGGGSVWGAPVEVYNETVLPLGYEPYIEKDGAGGAVLLWHRYYGGIYNSCVQHLDAAGTEIFPHNGLVVSTTPGMYHISPTLCQSGGDIYVFWREQNTAQSLTGLYGQRFDAAGTRLWGNAGMTFLPIDAIEKAFYRALPMPDGAAVYWIEKPGGYASDIIRGFRTDSDGDFLWPGDIIDVASTPSSKGRLPAALGFAGTSLLIWEDDRAGSVDIYGQRVNLDGSLGATGTDAEAPEARIALGQNHPNPFNPSTTIRFRLSEPGWVGLSIHDLAGRRVRTLRDGFEPGAGEHSVRWDGLDESGRPAASGIYLYSLRTADKVLSKRMVLVK